jgi:hypothetical protein
MHAFQYTAYLRQLRGDEEISAGNEREGDPIDEDSELF